MADSSCPYCGENWPHEPEDCPLAPTDIERKLRPTRKEFEAGRYERLTQTVPAAKKAKGKRSCHSSFDSAECPQCVKCGLPLKDCRCTSRFPSEARKISGIAAGTFFATLLFMLWMTSDSKERETEWKGTHHPVLIEQEQPTVNAGRTERDDGTVGLSEQQRRGIFVELNKALGAAENDPAFRRYMQLADAADAAGDYQAMDRYIQESEAIDDWYIEGVQRRYGLTRRQAVRIQVEGVDKNWPRR